VGFWDIIHELAEKPWETDKRELDEIDEKIDGMGFPQNPIGRRNYLLNTPLEKIEEDIEALKTYAEVLRRRSKSHNAVLGKVWVVESKIELMQMSICDILDLG
jgi:hypothetical protein